jgi:hypothetical protein
MEDGRQIYRLNRQPLLTGPTSALGKQQESSERAYVLSPIANERCAASIVPKKHKLKRARPYLNLLIASLVALVTMLGLIIGAYYSVEVARNARYRLACLVAGVGKEAHTKCHW